MIETYLCKIRDHFYEQMGQSTSAWLFGSAATGDWVPGRSDLDLFIVIPKERLASFGAKVRTWARTPSNPILDGYVFVASESSPMLLPLEPFANVACPASTRIEIIDRWYIKNRSKHLFGSDSFNKDLANVTIDELRRWALTNLQMLANGTANVRRPTISNLIWTTSWAARMLMLSKGFVCESKQEALRWLANEDEEIRDAVNLLLTDFHKTDLDSSSLTAEQELEISRRCIVHAKRMVQSFQTLD